MSHSRGSLQTLSPTTLPPIGQHGISIDHKGNLLLFDDGQGSLSQIPTGETRTYSAMREYIIDTRSKTASAGFVYSATPTILSGYCGSAYEAGGSGSYLVDFAMANNNNTLILQGIDDHKNVVFELDYPGYGCVVGWNAVPLKTSAFSFR